ncbi:hypothetical protein [Paenibacillus turpanensis]|uniref:hypothetical protein n=1 Tax=Paenibacillus turpanensis TaxID=2689078 RepID=UPI001A9E126E|nr:hypothetical protein [Paenibacillus turpanensis]
MLLKTRPGDSRVLANKMKSMGVYAIALIVFLIAMIMNFNIASQYKKDVDVAVFSRDVGGGMVVTSDMLQKKTIAKRDFDRDVMIPYSEVESVVTGKYTAHFIAGGVPLQDDWFTGTKVERYSYLNTMAEDEEFVTIPYDSKLSGGRILVPGDEVKMYAVYHEADPVTGRMSKLAEVDVLFPKIEIIDLLNQQEESIRNLLEDAERLPKAEQEQLLAKKEFRDKLLPKYLGLIMKHDKAEELQKFLGNGQIQIKLDLLKRVKEDDEPSDTTGSVVQELLTAPKENAGGPLEEQPAGQPAGQPGQPAPQDAAPGAGTAPPPAPAAPDAAAPGAPAAGTDPASVPAAQPPAAAPAPTTP